MTLKFSATKWSALLLGSLLALNVYGDTVYCEGNKQMMCLGFEQKIVDNNAVCFEPFTCSQEGFVCKSELNDLADEHEALLAKHNDLANTYNELLNEYNSNVADFEETQRCLLAASTLEDAKGCL